MSGSHDHLGDERAVVRHGRASARPLLARADPSVSGWSIWTSGPSGDPISAGSATRGSSRTQTGRSGARRRGTRLRTRGSRITRHPRMGYRLSSGIPCAGQQSGDSPTGNDHDWAGVR
jgi:hypothetical protein